MKYSFLAQMSQIFFVFLTIIVLLLVLAYALYADRKIWAAIQKRRGPNVVGPFGLLQSFADFFKFAFKELIFPERSSKILFLFAPFFSFIFAISLWAVIPIAHGFVWADLNVGLLYLFALSSLGVYGILIGGWSSHSTYGLLGALRSAAQMISYEVSIGFIFISVILCSGSLNITSIVLAQKEYSWFIFPLFPLFVVFIIVALAETNRPPFDLPEAESELVAGYMVEYSSTPYLLFMIAEFSHVLLMCALGTLIFLGGWLPPIDIFPLNVLPGVVWFLLKCSFLFFLFSLIKAIVPRYRYDQLMTLGWKVLLPITFFYTILVAVFLLASRV